VKIEDYSLMVELNDVLQAIDQGLPKSLENLFAVLRFPSVATDPVHAADCLAAANWLKAYFEDMGLAVKIMPTTGQPVVVADYVPKGPSAHLPHILFYGHYDVQPADPLELWHRPPFEPHVVKGNDGVERIFARGACDDKGQFMTFLEASRQWLKVHGSLPFRLTYLIEGDEEGDSSHLARFLAANRQAFKPDIIFVCDTEMWDADTPAITTFLRGCIAEEVTITGPRIDLHSGYYGGAAINPIKLLSKILGGLHDRTGKITIPGFYEGVKSPTPAARAALKKLGFNGKSFLKSIGLSLAAGEQKFSVLEQIWMRPTAEVNGILGGYTGAGAKTVLPAKAMAKLTFRLVAGQDPIAVRDKFRAHVRAQLPVDCKVSFISQGGDSTGISVATDSPWVKAATRALKAEWRKTPVMVGSGGSIPVVECFRKYLKADSLMVGFGLDEDDVHSPNENYRVSSYHRGTRSWARIIAEIAEGIPTS
jgi:acetylornithine deacetylase/succinyl-diaminopimelate desuccinylase-like protein